MSTRNIWVDRDFLQEVDVSSPGWGRVASAATSAWGSPDVKNQDQDHEIKVLAGAMYAVRLDDPAMALRVQQNLLAAMGTEVGGRTLALARNLQGYVIAADIVGFRDPLFLGWVASVLDRSLDGRAGINTLRRSAMEDPSNWGNHARAAVAAAAAYLDDQDTLAAVADRFHDWTGRNGAGFTFGATYWQADPDNPVGINPTGATIDGYNADGVLPDDQRRQGSGPPPQNENYAWEGLQGAFVAAAVLERNGYPEVWNWSNQALRRAYRWLVDVNEFPPSGDDLVMVPLYRYAYGEPGHVAPETSSAGKGVDFTDITHSSAWEPPAEEPPAEEPPAEEPPAEEPPAEEPPAEEPTSVHHVIVRPGDTLTAIAATFGTTVVAIRRANPWLTDPNLILVGTILHVPS